MLSKTLGNLTLVKIISRREILEEIVKNRLEPFNNYRTTANGKRKREVTQIMTVDTKNITE